MDEKKKNLEEENERLRKELFATRRSMQEFAYAVSHDFGAPLRAVTSFSGILKKQLKNTLDEKTENYLDFVHDGGLQMQAMLGGLLNFSRVYSQGKEPAPVSMQDIAGRVLSFFEETKQGDNFQVELHSLPPLLCDGDQITKLFTIVIENAFKYGKEKERLLLQIRGKDCGNFLEISVADNGRGVPSKDREKIFMIFKKLDPQNEGVGAGLAVAQRIVERHGGRIWAEESAEKGLNIKFTLFKKGPLLPKDSHEGEETCNLKQAWK